MNEEKNIYYNIGVILIAYFFLVIVALPVFFGMEELAEILIGVGYGIFGFLFLILSLKSELQ